jgi:hypothetical protein
MDTVANKDTTTSSGRAPSRHTRRAPLRVNQVRFLEASKDELRANFSHLFDVLGLTEELLSPLKKNQRGVRYKRNDRYLR